MKRKRGFFSSKYFSLLIIIVALLLIFTIWSKGQMIKPIGIRNIFNNMVLLSLIGCGACFLMLYGELDISAGAIGSFAGCICALLAMNYGVPSSLAAIIGIAIGCIAGFCNALLINTLRFPPFIATMAMSYILQGVGYMIASSQGINIKRLPFLDWIGNTKLLDGLVPVTIIISLIFVVVYGIILSKTSFGRSIYLCGGNRRAAHLCGLKPKKLSYVLYINSAFLASIAGILYISRVKTALPTALTSFQFTGITAAILGGVAFGGGAGNMVGCSLGMLILSIFNTGVSTVGFNANWSKVFNGLLLIIGLTLDALNARRSAKKVVNMSLATVKTGEKEES